MSDRVTNLMMQPIEIDPGVFLQKQPGRPSNGFYDLREGCVKSTVELWVVDEDGEVNFAYPACYAMIGFDTAYGYSVDGIDCSKLHAGYIVQLWNHILDIMPNTWDGLKGPLKWYNEFEGEWYDTLEDLTTLISGGRDAVEWFESVVKPALASQLWLVGN